MSFMFEILIDTAVEHWSTVRMNANRQLHLSDMSLLNESSVHTFFPLMRLYLVASPVRSARAFVSHLALKHTSTKK